MAKQNLFSILSRSPWWMSVMIAAALFAGTRLFLPDFAAFFAALPFLAIAGYAGWIQLRELYDAMRERDAHECIYVAAGDFTAHARVFAAEKSIRLLSDIALARLVGRVERGKRRWFPW